MKETDLTADQRIALRRHWWSALGAPPVGRLRVSVLPWLVGAAYFAVLAKFAISLESPEPHSRVAIIGVILFAAFSAGFVVLALLGKATRKPFADWLSHLDEKEAERVVEAARR